MIELIGVSKSFYKNGKQYNVIQEVDLTVNKGEITGIVGFSGAGKSTLIRLVNLLERPETGKVRVNGVDLTSLNEKDLAFQRSKIGMIFQHFNLISSKTVFENVALPLRLKGLSKNELTERVVSLLQLVGLDDKTEEYPKHLSGGQKQRVAIARALANNPEVLLCDEATSALDSVTTQAILNLLKEVNVKLKLPIIIVTHELDVVNSICDTIVVLEEGRVVENGKVEEVLKQSNHPIIRQHKENFSSIEKIEVEYNQIKYSENQSYTELEITLNHVIRFEEILFALVQKFVIQYHFQSIQVNDNQEGKVLLRLQGDDIQVNKFIHYLTKKNVELNIIEYA